MWRRANQSKHLMGALLTLIWAVAAPGCESAAPGRRVSPSYDPFTGKLVQFGADMNGDGRIDQWTYVDGNRPLRGESDGDGDGRIDRWEYFDANAAMVRVGSSSRNNGVEDRWVWAAESGGERRMDLSRRSDRHLDRREYYRGEVLARAEEDTNADGRIDRWDRYDSGVLREVALDTTFSRDRANRRLLYDARGAFEALEIDPDGDGRFERAASPTTPGGGHER